MERLSIASAIIMLLLFTACEEGSEFFAPYKNIPNGYDSSPVNTYYFLSDINLIFPCVSQFIIEVQESSNIALEDLGYLESDENRKVRDDFNVDIVNEDTLVTLNALTRTRDNLLFLSFRKNDAKGQLDIHLPANSEDPKISAIRTIGQTVTPKIQEYCVNQPNDYLRAARDSLDSPWDKPKGSGYESQSDRPEQKP